MKHPVKSHSSVKSILLPFSLTIFLSAFLLFQVQPIISKYILPWFGGSFSVWITAVLFFELLLLAGYLYAYLLTKLQQKLQIFIHAGVLAFITLIVVGQVILWGSPITPPVALKPTDAVPPVLQIIAILMISVGLPYFVLSTTSSLLQRWYSQLNKNDTPYKLYALSNAGSLIGILSYPFLIEIFLPIHWQGILWAGGFIVYTIILLYIARLTVLKGKATKEASQTMLINGSNGNISLWILLPLLSSLLLLTTTSKITQAVAPVPFLWLVPLGIYLLSFILCFDSEKWYWRWFYPYAFILSAVGAILITLDLQSIIKNFTVYTIFLFTTFMLLHGEVYRIKPDPKRLNLYYLCISFGGALGGIIVGVIAPLIFNDYWEYYIGIFLVFIIAISVIASQLKFLIAKLRPHGFLARVPEYSYFLVLFLILFGFAISFFITHTNEENFMTQRRNFYGTIGVESGTDSFGNYLSLYNGEINHGSQYTDPSLQNKPTTYYGELTGAGLALLNHQKRIRADGGKLRTAVVGLGIGTLATYGREGDEMVFYEINPAVTDIANEYFSYLKNSKAKVSVVHGDARLSMQKELSEKKPTYDVVVIDAFIDDAIPVHLLTKEAFAIYLSLLDTKEGILAIHISNRYLDLKPVILKAANQFNLETAVIESSDEDYQVSSATWVLLSKNQKALSAPEIQNEKVFDDIAMKDVSLWTDDYSNLFQALDLEW